MVRVVPEWKSTARANRAKGLKPDSERNASIRFAYAAGSSLRGFAFFLGKPPGNGAVKGFCTTEIRRRGEEIDSMPYLRICRVFAVDPLCISSLISRVARVLHNPETWFPPNDATGLI